MNVQNEMNQKVRNEIKVWYDQVYPNMEEVVEEMVKPVFYVDGKRMDEAYFQSMKQAVYAHYDIESKPLQEILVKGNFTLQSFQVVLQERQTKHIVKKCVKQWSHYENQASKALKEVWIFVYENDQR